jgi:hypothetical protein
MEVTIKKEDEQKAVEGTVLKRELRPNQIEVGDKVISYIVTPTKYYLDMQTKVQGPGGKIMLTRYAEEVLKRVEEKYTVNDFTPNEINEVIEGFDTFCNTKPY